jgi:hypothetical protein
MPRAMLSQHRHYRQHKNNRRNLRKAPHNDIIGPAKPERWGKLLACKSTYGAADALVRRGSAEHSRANERVWKLVQFPSPMLLLANLAVSRRQRIVNAMLHRRNGFQIGIHRFQVVIGQPLKLSERHD